MYERDKVNPKVVASSGGAGIGYAAGLILVFYLEKLGGDVPVRIEDAMVFLVTVGLAGIFGYLKAE